MPMSRSRVIAPTPVIGCSVENTRLTGQARLMAICTVSTSTDLADITNPDLTQDSAQPPSKVHLVHLGM